MTAKHQNTYQILTKTSNFCEDSVKKDIKVNTFECICGKNYKHKQSLFNHKLKCKYEDNLSNSKINSKELKIDEEKKIIDMLVEQNEKLLDTIKDQSEVISNLGKNVNNIGDNNVINSNNTNIILMLNNEYKDAINLEDFVKSLTINVEDLDLLKEEGLVKGIAKTFVKNLKKLDKNKRPVYCLYNKKDTIYVKENEKWEEDNKKKKIKESLNKVANKHRKAIDKWTEANPDYLLKEKKQNDYIKLVNNITQGLENTEEEEKIVKNIVNKMINK